MREILLCGRVCLIPALVLATACDDARYNSGSRTVQCELPGEVACGSACVDPLNDPAHCGATEGCEGDNAGADCGDLACVDGACVAECTRPGELACDGVCVDPQLDPAHCGATGDCEGDDAGRDCGESVCVNGVCGLQCPQGRIDCGGVCIDPDTDARRCGATRTCTGDEGGAACAAGEACSEGVCVMDCPEGSLLCDGGCVDPLTSDSHCGAVGGCEGPDSGSTCLAPAACVEGQCQCADMQVQCGDQCIDSNTHPRFCGARGDCLGESAGEACNDDEVCEAGVCACPGGGLRCGEACIDPQTDPLHCGLCDRACGDQACLGGACATLRYAGALDAVGGIWNFANDSGFDAAVAFCAMNFEGSTVCTTEMLDALSGTGAMAMAVSLNGEPVESFWAPEPSGCEGWNHPSGDFGPDASGPFRTLNPVTGEVGPQENGGCFEGRNIGCCILE